jgi:hypothetical protein
MSIERVATPVIHGMPAALSFHALLRQRWFVWPLALRVAVWLLLAHSYEMAVFQDASWQMVTGQGVYARFTPWLVIAGDGYYAAPPLYAYMLWVSGTVAAFFGGHWWLHQLLIKSWLLLADLAVMAYLVRRFPAAARTYWTLWFVPVVAIGQVQPDLFAGLGILAAFHLASDDHWLGAGLMLGLAAAVKPVPLLIAPFLIVYLLRSATAKALVPLCLGIVGALLAAWVPYAVLFPDLGRFTDVIRFHAARPIAGLTIPSGLLLLANAGLAAFELAGRAVPSASAAYDAAVQASAAYPIVTAGVFIALLASATLLRRWSLPQTFGLPLLAFIAANKVVHEHYILQVMPLALVLGLDMRGAAMAFSVYLLAAGSPLRYLPSQLPLPPGIAHGAPADLGTAAAWVLLVITGVAAVAFGQQTLALGLSMLRGKRH